jgi:hypothetical protein
MAFLLTQMAPDGLLLAFGFGALPMLGWLAAAAAPILIHLWNKRKYHEVSWAAMEYLLAAMRKNSRRIQLEQWLLLAVRTLLIVLLVLAVAQPFAEQLGLGFVAGQRTLKVLVVDGSYSMAYKPTDKSRFDKAKLLAAQIVGESRQGDAFALVLMAAPPSVVVGTPAMEASTFLEEIENLKMPHGGADLPQTLDKVAEILQRAESNGLARSEVYFLTDLGRNTWLPDGGAGDRRAAAGGAERGGAKLEPDAAEPAKPASEAAGSVADSLAAFRERVEQLARMASLVVIDLGQGGSENLAVVDLRTSEPFVTAGSETGFEAQVRNFGHQPQNHHLVECFVDGRRIKESYLDVAAGESAQLAFRYRFESPGDHAVEVRLGPDLLEIDDHRWLSQPVKEYLRVLCVNGKPAGGGLSGATDYLIRALNPEEDTNRRGLVRPEVVPESSLTERDLSRYDCVFLCNIGQFTGNEARLLDTYLQQGGGLVFFLGDRVQPDRYNQVLGGQAAAGGSKGLGGAARVLPALIKGLASESQYRFDPLDYRHPLVNVFKGREQAGLLTTPVYKYFRLELPPRSRARVALGFEGGDPAIVEETIHRGRSILVATDGSLSSLDLATKTPWTAWPAWPSYLPLVQEMLAAAVAGQQGEHNVLVGQAIGELLEPGMARAPLMLTTPDKRQEELRTTTDPDGTRWQYADTWTSGLYTLDAGSPANRQQIYAVNVDTAESNLARVDPQELPAGFTMNRNNDLDEPESGVTGHRGGLHKMLLYCVLGLLFCETFLAWRFGNRKS